MKQDVMIKNVDGYLNGYLLMAMPSVMESRFEHAVIFVCGHDDNGAIGLVLNKPLPSVFLSELLEQLKMPYKKEIEKTPLHYGGPVEMSRGFVLHSRDYETANTVLINEDYGITATLDVIKAIGEGNGPQNYMVALGYTGWKAGQLEQELLDNIWLVGSATANLIFKGASDLKWENAIKKEGLLKNYIPLGGGRA
ncbi:MAG: hypothetical protein CNLJKLNK_01094 [Holosporales bacterium]